MICCYANVCDIDEFWTVIYSLSPVEQSILLFRLGPVTCFNPEHLSMHWMLDVSNSMHEDIAKKLVKAALIDTELPNFWNIRLNGDGFLCQGWVLTFYLGFLREAETCD